MSADSYSELFSLIADYCAAQGLVPVGQREFSVGTFHVTVNGGRDTWKSIPPFHATVTRDDDLGLILVNPFRGTVVGSPALEDQAIAALRAALAQVQS